MKLLVFHFDVVSPYAYLAFERLPQVLEGCSYAVEYRPLLFAGLLQHWGNVGPAEIEPKRAWTYRQVAWLAARQGTPLQLPQPHPFNPLALQRLALAAAPAGGTPNRRVVGLLLRHVWCRDGADPNAPDALARLVDDVAPQRDPASAEVKAELRERTEAAASAGVFGVPTLVCDGRAFFGLDALPMLQRAVVGDTWFDGPAWDEAGRHPPGTQRQPR